MLEEVLAHNPSPKKNLTILYQLYYLFILYFKIILLINLSVLKRHK